MTERLVFAADLASYLGLADVDQARADQILRLAQSLCESIVSPLPDGAEAVILDVAARAWSNPSNAQTSSSTAGPFSETTSYSAVAGGLWLTRQNKSTLRRLNGGGGVFSIDMLPAGAGQGLPWWDSGVPTFDEPYL